MKYSIVITSTRPRLLYYSLRTALAQTFSDFEVVVSDNSGDDNRKLVEEIGGGRVTYVRPEAKLGVVAHWDFAFSHAKGDWHVLLCDDDAITPNLLDELERAQRQHPDVDAICWDYGSYCDDEGSKLQRDDLPRFSVPTYTGAMTRYDAAQLLAEMFESGSGLYRIKKRIPFFPRAAVRRSILDAIRQRQGQLFHPYCPMVSGAIATLSFASAALHIDLPMTLLGETADSCGAWIADPVTMDRTHAGVEVELAPIKTFRILPTAQAEAILRTQRAMPERLGQYRINYLNYFIHCDGFLVSAEARGFDTTVYRRVFNEALAGMPEDIQSGVSRHIAERVAASAVSPSMYLRARRMVGALIDRHRAGTRLPGIVNPKRLGLSNIFDCASYLGALLKHSH